VHLDPFELHRPTTIEESVTLAHAHEGSFDFLAGGTDLLPNYKMHLNLRPHLIALDRVGELSGMSADRIGAMTRLAMLERDSELATRYGSVVDAVREIATPLVRASATVGGNLLVETRCFFFNQTYFWRQSLGFCLKADGDACHVVPQKTKCYATFSGDLAPALMVHDAEVEIAGPSGRRRLPLAALYDSSGDGIQRHHLGRTELLVAVHLRAPSRARRSAYRKLRTRPSFDFPELGVAAALELDEGKVAALKLAVGGLETYPRGFDAVTAELVGRPLNASAIAELARRVVEQVRPVHNTFLAPDYRRRMTGVYVRRILSALAMSSEAS